MIDIHALDISVKSGWINRWAIGPGNADFIGRRGVSDFDKPVDQWGVDENFKMSDKLKYGIMCKWREYKQQFYRIEGNVGMACFFENDGLLTGKKNLGIEIFGVLRLRLRRILWCKTACLSV